MNLILKKNYASYKRKGKNLVGYNLFICHGTVQKVRLNLIYWEVLLKFFKSCFINIFETCISYISLLIFVPSGDSSGISVTGETPQERGYIATRRLTARPTESARSERKLAQDQDFLISPTSYIVQTK